ncbi:DUF6326 family protein [Geodermatophilus sp. SYSU D00766]
MFLYVYVDYLHLYKPGSLDEILVGVVHEFDTGPTFVALALTLVAVPILMIVLSATLPARAARATNLVVAALYIPVSIYNVAGEESWSYSWFYGLSIGLEVLLLAFVLRAAWTWPRDHSSHRQPRSHPGPGVTLKAGPVPVAGDSSSGDQLY